ncbi:MAG: DUF3784 domain-containing protein [Bacteroidales bacterium]|nr:DUF3784 domain-containing protein [Bacteroidales bacterium]
MHIVDLINITLGVFYILLGVAVYKHPDLIAGYNTMSEEEKQKFDIASFKSKMRLGFVITGVLSVAVGVILLPFDYDMAKTAFAICAPVVLCICLLFVAAKCRKK